MCCKSGVYYKVYDRIFRNIVDVAHIYALIFILMCGNALVFGFDLFLILLAGYSVLLLQGGFVSKPYIYWIFILVCSLVLYLIYLKALTLEFPYFAHYYLWPIKACICLLVLSVSKTLHCSQLRSDSLWLLSLAGVFFLLLVNFAGYDVNGRLSFVFGPNMLYRFVVAVTLIPMLMYLVIEKRHSLNLIVLAFLFILSMITLARIGSKGGVVLLFGALFILLSFRWGWRWYAVSFIFGLLVIIMLHEYSTQEIRFINFEGIDDSIRYTFLVDFLKSIHDIPLVGYRWDDFSVHATPGFQYPHNFVIELIYYFGISGGMLLLIILMSLRTMKLQMLSSFSRGMMSLNVILICIFVILLISSLFSGDMSDNFVLASLAMYGAVSWKLR